MKIAPKRPLVLAIDMPDTTISYFNHFLETTVQNMAADASFPLTAVKSGFSMMSMTFRDGAAQQCCTWTVQDYRQLDKLLRTLGSQVSRLSNHDAAPAGRLSLTVIHL